MMNNNNEIKFLSISTINKYLSYKFEMDVNLQNVYLQGEISNFKYSGKHCYFSLKDQNSEISAMFFYPNNLSLNFKPVDGMSVQVVGKIQIYQKKGTYAIIIQKMAQAGIGLLYQEFLELKEKLQKEGLFDETKKLKIPEYPERVAVITASTGEAIQDIVSTFNRRFPLAQIILYPALVQGVDAPRDLMRALKLVYRDNNADAIIIGRGGGSFEDLSCFNDEALARLLFESKIPTISAVGHEGDYTICDFVASFRAPTPTGAAVKLTKEKKDVIELLVDYSKRLKNGIKNKMSSSFESWNYLNKSYGLANFIEVIDKKGIGYENLLERLFNQSPNKIVSRYGSSLDELSNRLNNSFNNNIHIYVKNFEHLRNRLIPSLIERKIEKESKEVNLFDNQLHKNIDNYFQKFDLKLQNLIDKLIVMNPLNIMDRGYSITYKSGTIISSIKMLKVDDKISVCFHDGKIDAIINKISNNLE